MDKMPVTGPERRYKIKKGRLLELYDEWEAEIAQLSCVLSASEEIKVKRKAAKLEGQIKKLEEELQELKTSISGLDGQSHSAHWEQYIPKIDFSEVVEVISGILTSFETDQGGAALLLVQDAYALGGRWCVERVKQLLDENTADFRSYDLVFSPADSLNTTTFLKRLGEYIGCPPLSIEDVQEEDQSTNTTYAGKIGDRIFEGLQSGSVVFINLSTWDHISLKDRFLPWFVEDYWPFFLDQLPELVEKYPFVYFVTMIVVQPPISQNDLHPELCCTYDEFDSRKALHLPLRYWTKNEIEIWLLKYSGLTSSALGLQATDIKSIAERIFEASQGEPDVVHSALLATLEQQSTSE